MGWTRDVAEAPAHSRRGGPSHVWLAKLLFAVLSPVVLLGLLEVGFRLFSPFPGNWATYEHRDRFLYWHRPHSVGWEVSPLGEWAPMRLRYNAYGFRGEDFPSAKSGRERRVMILGDSYVEARQLREEATPSGVLERLLRQAVNPDVRVINAGLSGTSTIPEVVYLKFEGLQFEPDVVVLVFCFNDYSENGYHRWVDYPDYDAVGLPDHLKPAAYAPDYQPFAPEERLARRSAFYNFFYQLKVAQESRQKLGEPIEFYLRTTSVADNPKAMFKDEYTGEDERVIALTHDSLARLKRYCDEQGIPLVVVGIPWPHQVSGAEWNLGKQLWGYEDQEMQPSTRYQDVLFGFLASARIDGLDLLPLFREAQERPLHFAFDGHWTEHGAAQVARGVFDYFGAHPAVLDRLR